MADAVVDVSKLPPEQLARLPAGIPPPGVAPNLIDPPTIGYYVLGAGSVLMLIMLVCVALRLYMAIRVRGHFAAADWTTVAAVIGTCYYFIVVCFGVQKVGFGTHMYDLSLLHMKTKETAIISFMSNGPTHLIWPCAKSTFFLMYLQLFRPLKWLRYSCYVGLALNWAFYVSISITQMVITAPAPGQPWAESFATPSYLRTFKLCVPTASFSLVSDVYIMALPMIAISHLQLSTAKKFGVGAMFGTGFICCCASSLSIYWQYRIFKNQSDYTYYVIFVFLTYIIEMSVGISTSCMPSLARLHKDKINPFRSRKSTQGSAGSRLATVEAAYPSKSTYAYMKEEDSYRGHSSHELERVFTDKSYAGPHPSDRIHLNVEISQTSAPRSGEVEPWGRRHP